IDDVDETYLVDLREIAGLHPAVDERLGRSYGVLPVAAHHDRSAIPELADFSRRQRLAFRTDDLRFAGRRHHAAAHRLALVVLGEIAGRGGRGFGHAPALPRLEAGKALLQTAHQLGRRRRAAVRDGLE